MVLENSGDASITLLASETICACSSWFKEWTMPITPPASHGLGAVVRSLLAPYAPTSSVRAVVHPHAALLDAHLLIGVILGVGLLGTPNDTRRNPTDRAYNGDQYSSPCDCFLCVHSSSPLLMSSSVIDCHAP